MWELNPLGFHLVNIALHAVSALLVWRILEHLRIPGACSRPRSSRCTRSTSRAWRDIAPEEHAIVRVSAALGRISTSSMSGTAAGGDLRPVAWHVPAVGVGQGPAALTLPVVLLACAWWQRQGAIGRRDVLGMLPFLLIAALMVGMEVTQQHAVAGTSVVRSDSFLSRTAIASYAVWFYFWKLLWPANLVFIYPQWNINERNLLSYLPGVLLVVILALAWWRRRSWGRPVVMAMVCYVALLLPVLGFVNIYFMEYSLVADHWQYAAMIVPCAMAAALVTVGRRLSWPRPAGYAACLLLLATLSCLTWQQTWMYTDIETLFRATIDGNPACWMAHNNLALLLADSGRTDEAIFHTGASPWISIPTTRRRKTISATWPGAGRSMKLSSISARR